MLTFRLIDLLIVLLVGVVLLSGLSLLILRRRDEILQDYLTPPDGQEIEQEFFRRKPLADEKPSEEPVPQNVPAPEEKPDDNTGWGISAENNTGNDSVEVTGSKNTTP
jgi:hypothetical protein